MNISTLSHGRRLIKTLVVMKLTVLLIILACFKVSAAAYAQGITLNEKNASFARVLKQIEKQSGYIFFYNNNLLKQARPVSISLEKVPLLSALEKCFANQPLTYEIIDNTIIVKIKEKTPIQKIKEVLVLPINIKGRITDTTGRALPGAVVKVKGSNIGVSTNNNGEFEINGVVESSVLMVTYVGYITVEIPVSELDNTQAKIVLKQNVMKLNSVNVVSTGYQDLPKERATGSFVQINNELLNRRVSTDILSKLEGIVSGLIFNRNTINGTSGGIDIGIRGTNTFFASQQPLIVIDGFPYDGNIDNINPNSIESITVLKDAAAASIWGVKSGNGVIVITSKKGRRNQKLSVDANANVTVGERPDLFYNPQFIKSADFIDLERDLFTKGYYDNDLADISMPVSPVVELLYKARNGEITNDVADGEINKFKQTDVRNDLSKYFYQTSVAQQYSLNMKGGSNNSDYFVAFGYDKNLAPIVGNNSNRLNINTLNNFYPAKNLQISVGLNFTQSKNKANGQIDNIRTGGGSGKLLYPYAQLVSPTKVAMPISRDYNYSWVTDSTTNKGLLDWQYRPYDEIRNADNTSILNDIRVNTGINYSFLQNFSIDVKYQYEKANTNSDRYYNQNTYIARNIINSYTDLAGAVRNPVPLGGILDASESYLTVNRLRSQLNYNKNWKGSHEFNALAGSEVNQTINNTSADRTYGYDKETGNLQNVNFTDYFPVIPSNYGAQIPNNKYIIGTTDRYVSYFGNAAYSFKERYILSVSGRIDKSNLFGVSTNQKAVPLYSTGLSWDFSKENFYSSKFLPYGRVRLTYGYNGNVEKSTSAYLTTTRVDGSYYSGIPYAVVSNPGNKQLRWEKVKMLNLGLDLSLKDQVISGSVEYYHKNGIDLFGDSPLPTSTGLSTFRGNTASTVGKGIDVSLNFRNFQTGAFKWSTNFIYSFVTDKVSKYDYTSTVGEYIGQGYGNAGLIVPLVGKPIFAIYSYPWAGLDPENGDPQGYLNGEISKDYTSILSTTTTDKMVYNGPSRPTTFGSLRNTFSYNSFSLSFNIIYKLNYYFRRSSLSSSGLLQSWSGNVDYYKRWQEAGDEKTTNVPSIQFPPIDNNRDSFYGYSSALIEKGDHIRLQDINLSYHLDKRSAPMLPFSSLDLYCYINNIGILWRANKYNLDPDAFSESYPLPKTISFGLKAGF